MFVFMDFILPCLAATEKSTLSSWGQFYTLDFYWHSFMCWVGMNELPPK